jgi:hypothetical protein
MPQTSFFYPSVGISAIVSDMVEMPDAISYLKLRGALAYVGGGIPRGITGQAYQSTNLPSVYIPDTYQRLRQLHPEMTRSWEAGLDMRLFDNTIRLEATYYRTNTFDQVILLPLPSGGTYSHAYHQTGNVQNEGVELQLSVQPRWRNFKWTPGLMASYNKNTIVDLGGRDVWGDAAMQYNVISSGSMHVRLTPGGSMGDLWASSDLATDDNGNVFVNKNGGILVESLTEYRKVGSIMPDWKLGFGNTFQYKGITLSALVAARLGGQVFSRTQAILDSFGVSQASADMRDRGGMKINNGMVSAETWYKAVGGKQGVYRFYVYDADNVRLQEVSLGYALPSKWFGDVLRMRVSAVGRNLWMIYNKAPFDPEASASVNDAYQGLDYFMQPSLKNFGFSVKVDF